MFTRLNDMKAFIPVSLLVFLLSLALGEPTVGDGYASARGGHGHGHGHGSHSQPSLSQEYGPPSGRGFGGLRNSPSQRYGAPARSLSQQYGAPGGRPGLSQEYGAPGTRNLAQEYGAPNARSGPSQEYGTPSLSGGLNREYGAPDASRAAPSSEYGTPDFGQGFPTSLSQSYGAPRSRGSNSLSRKYGAPGSGPSQSFGSHSSHSVSSSYGAPGTDHTDAYSQDFSSISQTYGAPDQRSLSDAYGAPNGRSLSREYGAPSARSSPSQNYGAPSARDAMPSDQYGVPNQHNDLSSQGYDYAKNALDELLNQEPANYEFSYKVDDFESGSDFGHSETRHEDKAEGSYFVLLPDGTKQVVEYEADERGYKPRISLVPADDSAGYDDNASDLSRSAGGPY